MGKHKAPQTPGELAAAKRNFASFFAQHPERGNYKHGATSINKRKRFSDRRTKEGKRLSMIIGSIVDDMGGPKELTASQRVLVDISIRPKLITLLCIGEYVDRQDNSITSDGDLIKCLSRSYLAFSNSLRLDLVALYALITGKPSRVSTVEQIMARIDEGKEG